MRPRAHIANCHTDSKYLLLFQIRPIRFSTNLHSQFLIYVIFKKRMPTEKSRQVDKCRLRLSTGVDWNLSTLSSNRRCTPRFTHSDAAVTARPWAQQARARAPDESSTRPLDGFVAKHQRKLYELDREIQHLRHAPNRSNRACRFII